MKIIKINKAIFLDRDGVINEDKGYVYKIQDFNFLPGIFVALKKFQSLGYKLFIITNQSGIGRGYYSKEDYQLVTKHMLREFLKRRIYITKIYCCLHNPEVNCEFRKPNSGMIFQAVKKYNIDIKSSWLIGDKISDIEAGERAGCKTILIDSRYVKESTRKKFRDLQEVSDYILETDKSI